MGKKKSKPLSEYFERKSRCRSPDGPDVVREEEAGEAAFEECSASFEPTIPKAPTALTLSFKSNVKISRGDTIEVRLTGFKGGKTGVFALEERDHPEKKDFCDSFHAFWRADYEPKGKPHPSSVSLLCRKTVEADTQVIIGIPESVRIGLPEKLPKSSTKIKIDATLRHNTLQSNKIERKVLALQTEVPKKRALDDMISEVEGLLQRHFDAAQFVDVEEEQQLALEVTAAEVDQIWEAAHETSELKLGITFDMLDVSVFKNYQQIAGLSKVCNETWLSASKKRQQLALERELARNLGVKVGAIVVLEDTLFSMFSSRYPELTRGAILILRLYTCESHDLARILCACGVNDPPCIYRQINSALRCGDPELVQKWTYAINTLSTCCSKLAQIPSDLKPVLYRGVKELPAEAISHLLSLKKGNFYVFPHFTSWFSQATPLKLHNVAAPSSPGAVTVTTIANAVQSGNTNVMAFSQLTGDPSSPGTSQYDDVLPNMPPDSSVLFEVHSPAEGVELCDISQYPEDGKWLLPMFSAFDVVSVESLSERNNLVHVVLKMSGNLGGSLRDDRFPEDQRYNAVSVLKKVKSELMFQAEKSAFLAKAIYTNYKLTNLKRQHPEHAQAVHHLEKYAEVRRASLARAAIDDGSAKWQQQVVIETSHAQSSSSSSSSSSSPSRNSNMSASAAAAAAEAAAAAALIPQSWDIVHKKQAIILETALLKRNSSEKQFELEGVTIDFEKWTADFGKGLRNIRRLVGKAQTHPFMLY